MDGSSVIFIVVGARYGAVAEIRSPANLAPRYQCREVEMSQTCDRCGPAVRASYRVERTGELFLCGHCASRHWPMLSAQGWDNLAYWRACARAAG